MIENYYPSKVWAYCQYCGSQDISWEGTHKMTCNSCTRTFFINAATAVIALIINKEGQVLFTRRKYEPAAGKLDLPGGFVNLGETPENAVKRELKEELNLTVKTCKYKTSFTNRYVYDGITYFTADIVFSCTCKDLSHISADDDVDGYGFINPNYISLNDLGLESVKKLIRLLLEYPSSSSF
jgi:ADP-ribose pyrophosphatase YjhB (NUDIX family)